MELKDFIIKICADLDTKEEVINRLANLRLIDAVGVKYFLIHQHFIKMLSQNYTIMEAVTLTADEFNISQQQVYNVRKWWKRRRVIIKAPTE